MTLGYQLHLERSWVMSLLLVAIAVQCGCTRNLYRRQADRESNYLVREKSVGTPWEIPQTYTIQPDPRSRFFDATDPDHPTLPPAGPELYQYQLPELSGSRKSWQPEAVPSVLPALSPDVEAGPPAPGAPLPPTELQPPPPAPELPPVPLLPQPVPPQQTSPQAAQLNLPTPLLTPAGVQLASFQEEPLAPAVASQTRPDPFLEFIKSIGRGRVKFKDLTVQPVGDKYWHNVPANCLALMLDFESVRDEYVDTYNQEPATELRDGSPRVTLHDLFELALINSRDYQRQKEILYQTALDVSLERFAYATKFSVRGGTVDTTYTHSRNAGVTVNSLTVPSTFAGDKALATGGTLVGQFANDILLTFNGPSGFAADVSSELLLEVTQRVFQRDILLEPLIQSERNLVYAARDFARFRKSFFLDIADEYYGILRGYRRIEIQSQNYFAQVRTFEQALKEVESGVSSAPNVIFLNQYERGVLEGLRNLIVACNTLEQNLDRLKVTIGVPTETAMNIDLDELVQLTLRDTIEVNRAQASRWLSRLEKLREGATVENQSDILTADYSLSERLIKWVWERSKITSTAVDPREAFKERAIFRLDAARLDLISERERLVEAQVSDPPKQRILVFQRQVEVLETELALINRQLDYADALGIQKESVDKDRVQCETMEQQFAALLQKLDDLMGSESEDSNADGWPGNAGAGGMLGGVSGLTLIDNATIIALIDEATSLLAGTATLSQDLDDQLFGMQVEQVDLERTLERTDKLIEFANLAFSEARGGLPPIDISVDEAMVTALVQRLDLMNERGALADDWRAIKLAADNLKSNLSLSASQRIGTDTNRPFSFSTDNANTRLRLAWDLPLNRKRERNVYRRSLINYNAGLRSLMLAEDNIKFNVRSQMRNLAQARVQYPISVDQAALAEEQVVSTRLQLILGVPGVRGPDLLDAYNSAREALGQMVDARIGYITERARFALELEVLMLDDEGYWPQINDPKYQPEPNGAYPWNGGSAYGTFPSYLKVSHEYRRMLHQAPPGASPANTVPSESPTLDPAPTTESVLPDEQ